MASTTRENPLKTSKEMPFIVSLFFLFIYISIFYACSLSPSSVLHNSTFWFLISNTLVFIIATDYASFSCPRQKFVVYLRQEHYQTHIQTKPIASENRERSHCGAFEEKVNPENWLIKSVVKNDPENPNEDSLESNMLSIEDTTKNQGNSVEESKPEKVERGKTIEETTKNQGNSAEESKPEKVEREQTIEETDQFSKLTDEELNRRVEEFIKKFNEQIRLQRIQENLQKSQTV